MKRDKPPHTRSATPVDAEIGRRLLDERKHANLTQSELAHAVGISFQQIQKYERGFNRISVSRLADFAKVLRVPISTFFDGFDAPSLTGGRPKKDDPKLSAFFQSREGRELLTLFMRIRKAQSRKLLLEFVRSLQDDD
jgi:transcriptional regulator with XRE-family HTH domain